MCYSLEQTIQKISYTDTDDRYELRRRGRVLLHHEKFGYATSKSVRIENLC